MPSTIDIAIRTTTIVASRISSSSRQPSSLHRGTNRGDGSAIDRLGAAMPVPSVTARLVADRGAEDRRRARLAARVDAVDVPAADDDQPIGELQRLRQLRAD